MEIISTQQADLKTLALCHIKAFPKSFSSRLGKNYVAKMLGWYLSTDKSFIFHLIENNKTIGYCGGIIVDGTLSTGSASGMTQYSFNDAIKAMMVRPWLLFHPEVTKRYAFLWRNIKTKLGLYYPKRSQAQKKKLALEPQIGLVVIGVNPEYQGKGYGSVILKEFEKKAFQYKIPKLQLSVKISNSKAIKAYKRNGWEIVRKTGDAYSMIKYLSIPSSTEKIKSTDSL